MDAGYNRKQCTYRLKCREDPILIGFLMGVILECIIYPLITDDDDEKYKDL